MKIIESLRLENIDGEECHILIKKCEEQDKISLSFEVYYYNRYVHEWLPYSTLGIKLPGINEIDKHAKGYLNDRK